MGFDQQMNLTDALPTLHLYISRLPSPDSRFPTPEFCNKSNQLLPTL
ncbi:hypothetical protein [Moorena producens]